ncbi:MAG TPA: DMT family transporter [Chitinophagaceae bacterium]|jgi:drug/metabolite transporter (DMT)-like permease|nr:DMT family transporter [Chitinophagaceae bacterium]
MNKSSSKIKGQYKWLIAGLLFAVLWASASTATKIGLTVAQPLVIAVIRFGIAGIILLVIAHLIARHRLPAGKEWQYLSIYGLCNITIYLGCFVIAMQHLTAGIGSLAIATNPLFISFLSVLFLKKKLTATIIAALLIGTVGVLVAAWPLLKDAIISTSGLLLLLFSMLSYSVAAIYFSAKNWNGLHLLSINGWQTLLGGLFLLPFALFFYKSNSNIYNSTFWGAVFWLVIPVSIFAVQLWLWLLKTNTVKAGLWLFLCPVFGFAIAAWLLHDSITYYTIAGIVLVVIGLLLAQKTAKK